MFKCEKKDWLGPFKENPLWSSLNESQQQAVELTNHHALILAGAGTGKTKTLIARVASLLQDGGMKASDILAVTFTNKAAQEMKDRVERSIGNVANGLVIGTFHAITYKWIREDWAGFGYKNNANVMDTDDQKALVKRLYKDKGWDDKSYPLKIMMTFVNTCKEKGIRAKDVNISKLSSDYINYLNMYKEYEQRIIDENCLDFAELLMLARDRLKNDKDYFDKMSGSWGIILVDEFQDTNPLQYELLELLVKKGGSLFAVGDDDQSVYGFRGARVENVFDFERDYAKDNVVRLEQNYRCTGNILGIANDIIDKAKKRLGKKLWTSQEGGALVNVIKYKREEEEAREITKLIQRKTKFGIPPEHIAILYRINAQSRLLEQEMIAHGIPYKIVGGLRFYEREEVKTAMAHARILVTLDDTNALIRSVSKPARGIGKKRLDLWRNISLENKIGLSKVIEQVSYPKKENIPVDEIAKDFFDKVKEAREGLVKYGLAKGFSNWIESIGLKDAYKNDEKYEERIANIEELVNAIARYEENGGKFLDEFLTSTVLDSNAGNETGSVLLSSIHASKGLEFEHVYIVGVEDNMTPYGKAVAEGGEDEERRLAYVAVTRAKEELVLSFSETRMINGERFEMKPSRYLSDFDPKYIYPVNTGWPPTPKPVNWGVHAGKPNGMQLMYVKSRVENEKKGLDSSPEIRRKMKGKPNNSGYSIGDIVKHPRFGLGEITSLKDEDDEQLSKANIRFRGGEVKLLYLQYSGIKKMDPNLS